jgi:hypothetical protein
VGQNHQVKPQPRPRISPRTNAPLWFGDSGRFLLIPTARAISTGGCGGVTLVPEKIGNRVKQTVSGLANFLQMDAFL